MSRYNTLHILLAEEYGPLSVPLVHHDEFISFPPVPGIVIRFSGSGIVVTVGVECSKNIFVVHHKAIGNVTTLIDFVKKCPPDSV